MGIPERAAVLTTAPGSGLQCDACSQPITSSQVECRCAGARFHQWCHYARLLSNPPPAAIEGEARRRYDEFRPLGDSV
jgi:hypothetical protein